MDASEYLETIVAEGYKREIDQEENVIRSLPFVAAALAVLVTLLGFAKSYIPGYELSPYPQFVFAILLLRGVAVFLSIGFLFIVVIPREFRYLARSEDHLAYAQSLRDYYDTLSPALPNIERAIIEDLRAFIIDQYAVGTSHSQRNNFARQQA